jgi:putative PIG3 family NAD(P)H quinone oxidoreductase
MTFGSNHQNRDPDPFVATIAPRTGTMRAVVCDGAGDADVLRVVWRPIPQPRSGEVLIRVGATALNRSDILQRAGRYVLPPGTTDILGLECAGIIEMAGSGVANWRTGQRVCALLGGGGYAEYVAVPADHLFPVPDRLSIDAAAALPEALCTVYSNLVADAGLRSDQFVLIHGGGSGIGTTSVQIARALRARPIVTVGSSAKAARSMELGAEAAIDYNTSDFVEQVLNLTGGEGVDVILDSIGAAYASRNITALADDGILLLIGMMSGTIAEVDLGVVMRRRLRIMGSTLRARSDAAKAAIVAGAAATLWSFIEDGSIAPVVDSIWELDRVAEAHRYLESSNHFGKIVLTVGDGRSGSAPGA